MDSDSDVCVCGNCNLRHGNEGRSNSSQGCDDLAQLGLAHL